MKRTAFLSFLLLLTTLIFGQAATEKSHSLFFEMGGSGGIGSFNYEKHFYQKGSTELTWRLGLSFAPIDKNNGTAIIFPIMVNALVGKNKHKLELGLGQGLTVTTKGSLFALTTPIVGYRYQAANKKWFYRISYSPLISYLVDFQIQQWGGVSIGYRLNNKEK